MEERAVLDTGVLGGDVVGEFGAVAASVWLPVSQLAGFIPWFKIREGDPSENPNLPTLIPREMRIERLQQRPDIRRRSGSTIHRGIIAIREANPNGLVDVQHIRVVVEAVRVEGWRLLSVDEPTRSVFLE